MTEVSGASVSLEKRQQKLNGCFSCVLGHWAAGAADDLLAAGGGGVAREAPRLLPGRDLANHLFCSQNGQINRKRNR